MDCLVGLVLDCWITQISVDRGLVDDGAGELVGGAGVERAVGEGWVGDPVGEDAKSRVTPSAVRAIGTGPPLPPAFMTRASTGPSIDGIAAVTERGSETSMSTISKTDLPVVLSRSRCAAWARCGLRQPR